VRMCACRGPATEHDASSLVGQRAQEDFALRAAQRLG
jgi:hypothetical protein